MTIPLNELSAIYNQSIAEDCGKCSCGGKGCPKCDKKKEKKVEMLPQGNTPMGGNGARPGKNRKSYVEPMAAEDYEGYEYAGKEGKQHKVSDGMSTKHLNNKEFGEFSRQKLGRSKKKVTEGHCDVEGVECSPVEKKKDKKKLKEYYSNWRTDLREVVDVADQEEVTKSSPKTDTEASKQIKEKNVKNKIKINPPQGVTEGFEEIGGVVVEMYELTSEEMSVSDQMKVSQDYFKKRAARSPEEKEAEKEKHSKARARISSMHKKPDPYKARAGESD